MVTPGGRASLSVFKCLDGLGVVSFVLTFCQRFCFFKRWVGCGIVLPRFGDPATSTGTWKGALHWLGTGSFHIIILEPWRVMPSWKCHVSKWTFISHWYIFRRSKIEDCRKGFRTISGGVGALTIGLTVTIFTQLLCAWLGWRHKCLAHFQGVKWSSWWFLVQASFVFR